VNDLFRQMRANGPDFEITRDPWNLYVAEPGTVAWVPKVCH
jgi:hypothetical protein